MEVITMESSAYMALTEQIAEIASHIRKSEDKKAGLPDRQVDSAEAARILGISRRTLQRVRDRHRIRYTTLGGKCMYLLSEIDRFITEHTVGSVLNPGTVIGRNSNIYPLSPVRGCIPADSIYKNAAEIVKKN